jgi:hypothetical protein
MIAAGGSISACSPLNKPSGTDPNNLPPDHGGDNFTPDPNNPPNNPKDPEQIPVAPEDDKVKPADPERSGDLYDFNNPNLYVWPKRTTDLPRVPTLISIPVPAGSDNLVLLIRPLDVKIIVDGEEVPAGGDSIVTNLGDMTLGYMGHEISDELLHKIEEYFKEHVRITEKSPQIKYQSILHNGVEYHFTAEDFLTAEGVTENRTVWVWYCIETKSSRTGKMYFELMIRKKHPSPDGSPRDPKSAWNSINNTTDMIDYLLAVSDQIRVTGAKK